MLIKKVVLAMFLLFLASCDLVEKDKDPIAVKSISLDRHIDSVEIGKFVQLSYTIEPRDAANKEVTWLNNNTTIASLNGGSVKGLNLGKCRITVKTKDGGFTDTCQIKVIPSSTDVLFTDIPRDWPGFKMGSSNTSANSAEKPQHPVQLDYSIKLSTYEVTNSQFCFALNYALSENLLANDIAPGSEVKNLQGVNVAYKLIDLGGYFNPENRCAIRYDKVSNKFSVAEGMNNRPVNFVTWYGAAFYCNMLSSLQGKQWLYDLTQTGWPCTEYGQAGYRLPTEAEWEYSASYNDGRFYPWGSGFNSAYANCSQNNISVTNVGSFITGKNKLGIFDLSGNVAEWCQDWYYNKYYQSAEARINPTGPADGSVKVLRGGSWYYLDDFLRCQARDYALPDAMMHDYGFRVAFNKGF